MVKPKIKRTYKMPARIYVPRNTAGDIRRDISHEWSDTLKAVWRYLQRHDRDVLVSVLAKRIGVADDATDRLKMQRVGAVVCRLNKKLENTGRIVRPGIARRTYRNYSADVFK